MKVTLQDIRDILKDPQYDLSHALPVLDVIERRIPLWDGFAESVELWLSGEEGTIFLRDEIMEPIKHYPTIAKVGLQFSPSTAWHNTWTPLDTARFLAVKEKQEVSFHSSVYEAEAELRLIPGFGAF